MRDGRLGKKDADVSHSLSETDAREILRSSYMNTFFTNGLTGNPYMSSHSGPGSRPQLLGNVILDHVNTHTIENEAVNCAAGSVDDARSVTLEKFLFQSPQLEVGKKKKKNVCLRVLPIVVSIAFFKSYYIGFHSTLCFVSRRCAERRRGRVCRRRAPLHQ